MKHNACKQCVNRIKENGKVYCRLYPDEDIVNEPMYYIFSNNKGTGYPDSFICDCEDFDGIEGE